jgi:hypothetical protein
MKGKQLGSRNNVNLGSAVRPLKIGTASAGQRRKLEEKRIAVAFAA